MRPARPFVPYPTPMFQNRSLKVDLVALFLIAAAVLLGASLFTYDATDPPSTLVHPPKVESSNACGLVGAYVAHYLVTSVGFGAFYVLTSLSALALLLLWRQEVNQPVLRGVGWVASLAAAATIAAMALPQTSPGPEIGAGGYLGAMGFALLESHFAALGAYILALAVLLAGLLLCTDYLLLRFAAATTASGAGLMTGGRLRRGANGLTEDADDEEAGDEQEYEYDEEEGDEYEDAYEEDEDGEAWEDDDEEAWEDDYDQEEYEADDEADEHDDEDQPAPLTVRTPADKADAAVESAEGTAAAATAAAAVATGLKNKISSALRIKNPGTKRAEREEVINQLEAAELQGVDDVDYQLPPLDLLLEPEDVSYEEHEKEVRRKAKVLEKTFRNFGFNVKVVEIETGPVIAQYEIELEAGLRLSKITGLADDLAIALRVPSVRIVAPIPGKNTVGIEVPNETRQLVRLREVIEETNGRAKRMKIPVYLGKDVSGNSMVVDLAALPHLLIAGRTGTGKSVCLNSIIVSMLMSRGPDEVRMLMIDPKMVELSGYKKLPHLMHPVVTDMAKAEAILAWAVDKMEERYKLLARAGVRHVSVYNQLSEEELRDRVQPKSEVEWEEIPRTLPFIVIVADEMADLMMTAGKEVEQHIIRLAQKSRAVGIHLILATQKPTVDVITGLIKSNLPARIAFQVASQSDSRVVLDEKGADKLLGNGDMLFLSPGTSTVSRGQGTFLSDDEITRVTEFVGTDSPQFARELIELKTKDEQEAALGPAALKNRDELYEAAVDVVIREQRGSISLIQRCLGIGYGRAARLIDFMAEDGIVSDYNGQKSREVIMTLAEWEAMNGDSDDNPPDDDEPLTAANVQPKPRRSHRIVPASDEAGEFAPAGPTGTLADPPSPLTGPAGTPSRQSAGATALLSAPWEEAIDVAATWADGAVDLAVLDDSDAGEAKGPLANGLVADAVEHGDDAGAAEDVIVDEAIAGEQALDDWADEDEGEEGQVDVLDGAADEDADEEHGDWDDADESELAEGEPGTDDEDQEWEYEDEADDAQLDEEAAQWEDDEEDSGEEDGEEGAEGEAFESDDEEEGEYEAEDEYEEVDEYEEEDDEYEEDEDSEDEDAEDDGDDEYEYDAEDEEADEEVDEEAEDDEAWEDDDEQWDEDAA